MKTLISYTATGSNKETVTEKALQMYRSFVDDPDAEFPHNTVIQFRPETETHTGDGTVTLVQWSGDVIISQLSH